MGVGDAAVVGQVHARRIGFHQAADGIAQYGWVKLDGCGGGEHHGAVVGIKVAVGNPKGIAGEPAARLFVPHTEVMARMAWGVHEAQLSVAHFQHIAILHGDHALLRNGDQLAVRGIEKCIPKHRACPCFKFGGIDHVPCAMRMHHQRGIGQFLHQPAGAAGVVEVHVGEDHIAHRFALPAAAFQHFQDTFHAVVGAGFNDGRHIPGFQQVTGRHFIAHLAAVDGQHAAGVFTNFDAGGGAGGHWQGFLSETIYNGAFRNNDPNYTAMHPARHHSHASCKAPRIWLSGVMLALGLGQAQADVLNLAVTGLPEPMLGNVQNRVNSHSINDKLKFSNKRLEKVREAAELDAAAALRPYGYYRAQVTSVLEQQDEKTWLVRLTVSPGPPLQVSTADIQLSGPGAELPELLEWQRNWPMQSGQRVDQVEWEAQKSRALELAASHGYLDAQFTQQQIRADLDANTAELQLHLQTGPQAVMGGITYEQDVVDPVILQGLPRFDEGQPYDAWLLEKFRYDVWQTGYFDDVDVIEEQRLEESPPVVNLVVKAAPREPNTWQGTLGYGTDTGIRAQVLWTRRLLSSRGDSLDVGLGWQETNNEYSFRSSYRLPRHQERFNRGRQFWTGEFGIRKENQDLEIKVNENDEALVKLANGDVQSYTVKGGLLVLRDFEEGYSQVYENWYAQYLLENNEYQLLEDLPPKLVESISDEDLDLLKATGSSLSLGVSWDWPAVRGSHFATEGHRERLWLFTANEAWGSDLDFSQAYFSSTWHHLLGKRFKLLLRGEAGYSDAEVQDVDLLVEGQPAQLSVTRLPDYYRFKAGGSRSVRGYSFESLSDNGIGSNNIVTASAELEYEFRKDWAAAAFVDSGNAFNDWDDMDLKTGVGVGVRWYSIIGAIQLDVAHPLDLDGDPWRLHFTIGTPLL
jgi:translocation and assembly module TamA